MGQFEYQFLGSIGFSYPCPFLRLFYPPDVNSPRLICQWNNILLMYDLEFYKSVINTVIPQKDWGMLDTASPLPDNPALCSLAHPMSMWSMRQKEGFVRWEGIHEPQTRSSFF